MTDIEQRKSAALEDIDWNGHTTAQWLSKHEKIIRELLQPSPPTQSLSKLLEGVTPENSHGDAWKSPPVADSPTIAQGFGTAMLHASKTVADGEVEKALEYALYALTQKHRPPVAGLVVLGQETVKTLIRAAQQPRQEWRTVESAPRDGTWILTYHPTAMINQTKRLKQIDGWTGMSAHTERGLTHWQPLPSPPKDNS